MKFEYIFLVLEVFWFVKMMLDNHSDDVSEKEMLFSVAMFLFSTITVAKYLL